VPRISYGRPRVDEASVAARSPSEADSPIPPDYVERNRRAWDAWSGFNAAQGRADWSASELLWGLWRTPETELHIVDLLPPGSDIVELGCGTAGVSAWLKRGGFYPVAVDVSRRQLERASDLQREFDVYFPLVHSNAESVPYDRDSFEVAVSDYGASVWCDPARWIPEARRLLRRGGRLIFFTPTPILRACTPANGGEPGSTLETDYFSLRYRQFDLESGIEFELTYSGWARLLADSGFVIEDIRETQPGTDVQPRYPLVSNEWAQRWPSEVIWIARAVDEPEPRPTTDTNPPT
jgi:SAM-dependent methyltransferase